MKASTCAAHQPPVLWRRDDTHRLVDSQQIPILKQYLNAGTAFYQLTWNFDSMFLTATSMQGTCVSEALVVDHADCICFSSINYNMPAENIIDAWRTSTGSSSIARGMARIAI